MNKNKGFLMKIKSKTFNALWLLLSTFMASLFAYIIFMFIVFFLPEKKYENVTIILEDCKTFKDRCTGTGILYEKPFRYYYMSNSDTSYYRMPSGSFIEREGDVFKFSEISLSLTSYGWQLREQNNSQFN
jgi:hypothetical protein